MYKKEKNEWRTDMKVVRCWNLEVDCLVYFYFDLWIFALCTTSSYNIFMNIIFFLFSPFDGVGLFLYCCLVLQICFSLRLLSGIIRRRVVYFFFRYNCCWFFVYLLKSQIMFTMKNYCLHMCVLCLLSLP